MAVVLFSLIALATSTFMPALAYSVSEAHDMRPLRSEAANLHAWVQNWLGRTAEILEAPAPVVTPTQTTVLFFAWMGEKSDKPFDDAVQYDEIEALRLEMTWDDGAADYTSTLTWHGYADNRTDVADNEFRDSDWLRDTWLLGAPLPDQEVTLSTNVALFTSRLRDLNPATPNTDPENLRYVADIATTLMNFEFKRASGGVEVPQYSFQIVGGPNTYVMATD